MKTLPLAPSGCTLSVDGLAAQTSRAAALRPAVRQVEREDGALRVVFTADVDEHVVAELIATERGCCSFLTIDYDSRERVLSIDAADAGGFEAVAALTSFFEETDG